MRSMKAAVFVEPGRIVLDEKPVPEVGSGDALVRITTTTICGTDIHILNCEYPVERGRIGCGAWPTMIRSPLPTSSPGGALMVRSIAKEWPQSAGPARDSGVGQHGRTSSP
jgi:hypothetical protein